MDTQQLTDAIKKIVWNIEHYGLERYDPRDIRNIPVLNTKSKISSLIRYGAILLDDMFPITVRRLLRIKKSVLPTTYTFLAESFFLAEKSGLSLPSKYSSCKFMELCIGKYYMEAGGITCWTYEPNLYFYPDKSLDNAVPTMHLYGLTRCNKLLYHLGKFYKRQDYMDISYRTLLQTTTLHTIYEYKDGSMSISYHYNSRDCTLNVNAEFAEWISLYPQKMLDDKVVGIFYGIIKLILKEQAENGAWKYYSEDHEKSYQCKNNIDCHHSSTVIYNLISIYNCNWLDPIVKKDIFGAINSGLLYLMDNFFDISTGHGIAIIGYKRKAGPVQYSETVIALIRYAQCVRLHTPECYKKCMSLLPLLIQRLILYIDKNGSVPGDKVFKEVRLNSINWGNGAVLLALTSYYTYLREVGNETKEI